MAGGFDSLGLMPELIRAVTDIGWYLPTDVQDEAIPLILGGGDVMVASETGSGKTGAFVLPLAQVVHESIRKSSTDTAAKERIDLRSNLKLDPNDKDSMLQVSPDALGCSAGGYKNWAGGRATYGLKGGKYFYEAVVTSADGLCRFGWSTKAGHLELGRDSQGFGYGGTAKKSHNNEFLDYGVKFGQGDVVSCMIDCDAGIVSFCVNGTFLGEAFRVPDKLKGSPIFPAFAIKGSSFTINFGATAFRHRVDASYKPMCEATSEHVVSAQSSLAFSSGKRTPRALVLEPARDLAEQVYNSCVDITKYITTPSLRSVLLVGGDDNRKQKADLNGPIDILVGTPLKVLDCVKKGLVDLSQVRMFILDEADRLLETGNLQTVMDLYNACPSGGSGGNRLQVAFFSATLHSPEIMDLGKRLCYFPIWVDLKGKDSVPEYVHHVVCKLPRAVVEEQAASDDHASSNAKKAKRSTSIGTASLVGAMEIDSNTTPSRPLLRDVGTFTDNVHTADSLSHHKHGKHGKDGAAVEISDEAMSQATKEVKQKILLDIIDKFEMSQCMIFCRTNVDCDNLERFLTAAGGGTVRSTGFGFEKKETGKENKYSCCVLAGMRSMEERRRNLEAFKEGDVRFLICTDVAARGIDIQSLPYVINFTLPDEAENYIHRIGRVGRAEKMGLAISIVAPTDVKEKVWFHTCASKGANCSNRSLKESGGCTIWYDETDLLQKIERRLDMSVPELRPDYSLPESIASLGADYGGAAEKDSSTWLSKFHMEQLAPTVRALAEMETEAQNVFISYQLKFGNRSTTR